ncbi:hypothetical protein GCM10025868_04820 [Angustibacter aerolatus]|uniref:Uncharacterized protein n=1 Tax=Angustibacter aerolatus TaxID=1162965 RepID=A0ABQ6JEA0_9ACTN|nr:hypothetical protein GCM10025868_04820 [Angustibacter aerolatus]
MRVDGDDYRHRGLPAPPEPVAVESARAWAAERPGATLDDLDALCDHLAAVHPSRYGAMVDGVTGVALTGLHPVADQNVALRLVVLADRLYDLDVPLVVSGDRLDRLFPDEPAAGRVSQEVPALAVAPDGAGSRGGTRVVGRSHRLSTGRRESFADRHRRTPGCLP